MVPVRRLFVMLSAYEDIAERESAALGRGDIEQAITFRGRKRRIREEMERARRTAELSQDEIAALAQRVRGLESRDRDNRVILREEMARMRATLQTAVRKTREVRREFVDTFSATITPTEEGLGHA